MDVLLETAKPLDGLSAQIVTLDAYDETYGIAGMDLGLAPNPLATVAMYPSEDYLSGGRMERTIRSFRRHKVNKHYGMTLDEFLDLPRHINQFILEDCLEAEKEEGKRAASLLADLENQGRTP